jgi:NAD(P)-dependent dehydrogenase (short-subunit alcohol dehydrogenase family)
MRIVVTGASRGIGLEFVRQYLERGETVEAAARSPERSEGLAKLKPRFRETLRLHACDVAHDASARTLAASLKDGPVDLLINNAGVMGQTGDLLSLDLEDALQTIRTNSLGPLAMARALLPRLLKSRQPKMAHITSKMGSIADNTSGGYYAYRMSKAALNMASKSLAADLRKDGIVSVVFHPGWVKTDMGGAGALVSPEDSVGSMIRLIDGLTIEQSGKFFGYRGEEIPW